MCTSKSCPHAESSKSKSVPRILLALLLIVLGLGVSLHLRAIHFAHWWVPAAVLLVLAHSAIVEAVAWIVSRLREDARTQSHEHCKVLHRPRLYDWLVRIHALGNERRFRTSILQIAELQPGETALDVGCGTGSLLIEAAKQEGSGSLLHGLELSSEMLAHARRKAKELIPASQFVQGSAGQIPFPDSSFDVVFCTMVLHHLPASMQTGAIEEMCRVVRPSGRIVIVDMQPPQTVAAKLSIVTLFHKFGTDATAPEWQNIERVLRRRNFQSAALLPMWNGSVGAMVARMQASESRP